LQNILKSAAPTQTKPIYRLEVNGNDITTSLDKRLISLSLTDNRGFEADQLDLALDDADGKLDLPPRGALIRLAIGWADSGLVEKGSYTVDEVEHAGAPDVLTIRARSADLRSGLNTQRERSWHAVSLGDIVRTIADECDLVPCMSDDLSDEPIEHIDQTNESAANFLTRLAKQYDAIATVKNGRLIFLPAGGGLSVTGKPLPPVEIVRSSGDQHRFSIADRETYTAVKALWHDVKGATKGEEIVGKDQLPGAGAGGQPAIEPSAANVKTLRHVYATKANARRAALSELKRLQRGVATFSITLARGNPELFPQIPATVKGWKPAIDNTGWLISKVTHTLGDGGYTTALDLEIKASEIVAEAVDEV
jgi:uncharacterized protein